MSLFTKFDISNFFDEIHEPLFVFNQEEIIYFNKYYRENFNDQPDDWKSIFDDSQIQGEINDFFDKGELPKMQYIKSLKNNLGELKSFQWVFINLPSSYQERIFVAKGRLLSSIVELSHFQYSGIRTESDIDFIKSILRYSHDMVAILDANWIFKFISSSIIDKLGVAPEKIIGKSYLDLINQGLIDIQEGSFQDVLNTKDEVNLDFTICLPGKDKIYIESFARNLIDDPQIGGILFSARDITDFKKAEKSLQKRYELEKLINRISKKFVNASTDQIDDVFNESLKMLGEFEKADRAYIFLLHEYKREIEYAYEWTADEVEPQIEFLKSIQITDYMLTISSLKK